MTDHVWPEDQGTNTNISSASDADNDDAANHASGYHNPNATDFVVSGMGLSYDAGNNTVDIGSGKARVSDDSALAAQSSETRNGVTYIVETDARSGLSLTNNDINHVYLDVSLTNNDDVSFVINTSGSQPSQPSLKIGTVDTN